MSERWESLAYEEAKLALRLLRAAMHDPTVMRDLIGAGLRRDDFLANSLQSTWEAAVPVFERSGRLDPTLLRAALEVRMKQEEADDLFGLLMEAAPLDKGTDLPTTLTYMRRKVALQRLRVAGNKLTAGAQQADADPNVLAQMTRTEIERCVAFAAPQTGADAVELARLVDSSITEQSPMWEAVPLGIPVIDAALGGGAPCGRCTVVMAPSGVGKSTYARHMLLSALRYQKQTGGWSLYVTFESDRHEVARELVQMMSGLRFTRNMEKDVNPSQWSGIATALGELSELPLIVEDGAQLTADELCALVRAHTRRVPVRAVFIDYVQDLIIPPRVGEPAGHAHNSTVMRNLAASENIAVIELSQVAAEVANAEGDGKKAKRPWVESTAGSKKYGKDAAAILSIERDRTSKDDNMKNVSRVRLLKNRMVGTILDGYMRWDPKTTRLAPCTERGDLITDEPPAQEEEEWGDG